MAKRWPYKVDSYRKRTLEAAETMREMLDELSSTLELLEAGRCVDVAAMRANVEGCKALTSDVQRYMVLARLES